LPAPPVSAAFVPLYPQWSEVIAQHVQAPKLRFDDLRYPGRDRQIFAEKREPRGQLSAVAELRQTDGQVDPD
jgi:hypothetical protein